MTVGAYGKVWSFIDSSIRRQFTGDVEIEEKVDGSQFSVRVDSEGNRTYRSKGVQVYPEDPHMFAAAIEGSRKMDLLPGHTYRFEYLSKEKHNTLSYGRVPRNNLILFEVESDDYEVWDYEDLVAYADNLHNIEVVPLLYKGPLPSLDYIEEIIANTESVLGNEKIEGVVIKDRSLRHNQDGKALKAKVVSSAFKERHQKGWKEQNPQTKNIVDQIIDTLTTDARYTKAVQTIRDRGELQNAVQDIGPCIKVIQQDLSEEDTEYIKDQLFKHAMPKISRGVSQGFPFWYKERLAEMVKEEE